MYWTIKLILSAQDEFQRRIDEVFERLSGIAAILVYGHTKEEHNANLHAMLDRTKEREIKLINDKSIIIPELSFLNTH